MTNDQKFSHSIAELSERPEHDADNTINSITSVLDSETLASHEGTARRMTYIIIMAPARDCQPFSPYLRRGGIRLDIEK